ncbi:P-loop containing nucleoside triphosphate hydrolase [Syntrophomonas zehnderi OL-4]|uniref:p-loop containing nucleoside triphosphate hydrolase n=1 Tax=Syntrophomonas zehnderi OL-4 TaxID=690567 RepID=A0A0E4C9N9_9FIRM|nr:P-loop containing nucleoside triphosphate hydrolase [Syntrophomonas zehnderi OL-4]
MISFVGRHNSGKTTLLSQVINHLSQLGYKTAVVKHAPHTLNIEPRKDSERLYQAGADFVMASSPELAITYCRQEQELDFSEILKQIPEDIDLIIVEGFKNEPLDKIEVLRQEIDPVPMLLPKTRALITDINMPVDLPVFSFSQCAEITDFILRFLKVDLPG